MSELDVFGFIGMNRSIFSTLFLCGVLMPLAVVVVAYLFRHFPGVMRGAAMVSTLIGVVMRTFFTMAAQNSFFVMLSTLSRLIQPLSPQLPNLLWTTQQEPLAGPRSRC